MTHSDSLDQIAPALVSLQSEAQNIQRGATNTEFHSRYATLAQVWEYIRPLLNKHGLFVVQMPGPSAGMKMAVSTMVGHVSGQYVKHEGTFPIDSQGVHAAASAVTYICRYALQSALGIPSATDDDGNAAAGRAAQEPAPARPESADAEPILHPLSMGILHGFPATVTLDDLTPDNLELLYQEFLEPAVRQLSWARYIIRGGKNVNRFLGQLDQNQIEGSWKLLNERGPFSYPVAQVDALRAWKAWTDEQTKLRQETTAARLADQAPASDGTTPEQPKTDGVREYQDALDVRCHYGKNRGLMIRELTPQQIHWYETEWMPKFAPDGPSDEEGRRFYRALQDRRAWSEGTFSPRLPMADKTPTEQPGPTKEQEANAERLKARTDLPKRPRATKKPQEAAQAPEPAPEPSEPEKPPGGAVTAQSGRDWRDYVIPIGKPVEEGGNKGLLLGEVSLTVVRQIKEQYLDRQPWDQPEKLKPFALDLKRAVEDCLANDGQAPAIPPPDLPPGPLKDLYERLEGFSVDPTGEFLSKMVALGKLPQTCTKFESIRPTEAQFFLDNWEATMQAFESDLPWPE